MSTLGERLIAARERTGWTQEEVALRAQVPRQAISRLERGERSHVRSDVLGRLAIALEVSADFLLGIDVPKHQPDSEPATSTGRSGKGQRQAKRPAKAKA